jgi:accessory gene regulator B
MKTKQRVLNKFEKFLHSNINNLTEDDMEIALYGMEVIYSLLTKTVLFFIISIALGWEYEFLTVSLLLATVRVSSFGFHAEKEISCYILSFITIFGTIYITKIFNFNIGLTAIVCLISMLSTVLYAPADTEKRPLLNAHIRVILKICSIITSSFFSLIAISNLGFMSEAIVCILSINALNISPILYKIYKRRYKNYEYY